MLEEEEPRTMLKVVIHILDKGSRLSNHNDNVEEEPRIMLKAISS